MKSISEALKIIIQFKTLSELVDPDNGDQRWEYLQTWLSNHPEYSAIFDQCLTLSPQDALQKICDEFDVDLKTLQMFDRDGKIEGVALRTIETIQTLYRERAAMRPKRNQRTVKTI